MGRTQQETSYTRITCVRRLDENEFWTLIIIVNSWWNIENIVLVIVRDTGGGEGPNVTNTLMEWQTLYPVPHVSWNVREKQLKPRRTHVSDCDECQIKRNYRRQKVPNCPLVVVQSIGQTSSADALLFSVSNTKILQLISRDYTRRVGYGTRCINYF